MESVTPPPRPGPPPTSGRLSPWAPESHSLATDWQRSAPREAGGTAALRAPGPRATAAPLPGRPARAPHVSAEWHDRGRLPPRTTGPQAPPASALACRSAKHYLRAPRFLMSRRAAPTPSPARGIAIATLATGAWRQEPFLPRGRFICRVCNATVLHADSCGVILLCSVVGIFLLRVAVFVLFKASMLSLLHARLLSAVCPHLCV